MMACIENDDREQPRVEKVVIVHAGEDLNTIIRPLAETLETRLKLGEQADYKRTFRAGTDISQYVLKWLNEESLEEHTRLVVVISDTFFAKCSTNPKAFQQIKSKLYSQNPRESMFALVTPSNIPAQLAGLRCINLGIYIQAIETGNLAEAIYRQWFGPQATLSSQAESNMQRSLLMSASPEEYTPDKVKIIHAMTRPEDRQRHWGKIATAIETVANPENTTQARLHFKHPSSVAQTVLADVEGFMRCAEIKKINALVVWCSNMLDSLNQDRSAKARVIEILCKDTRPQKLYAHFLFGVDGQQMQRFSQQLWTFLSQGRHMAYIEDSHLRAPNVDYDRYARIFLRSWAGMSKLGPDSLELRRKSFTSEPKNPEESADPTMNCSEEFSVNTSGSTQHPSDQFHPQQDQGRDHLVMNGTSVDHAEANRTMQQGKALRSADSSTQDRLLTAEESWDPAIVAVASKSRESQSDGCSVPPVNHSLRGQSGPDGLQAVAQSAMVQPTAVHQAVVQQAMPGTQGQNKLATCSLSSVSVDSVHGSRHPGGKAKHVPSGAASISAPGHQGPPSRVPVALPSIAEREQPTEQAHLQPPGNGASRNKFALSGFDSHVADSERSSTTAGQELMSQTSPAGERCASCGASPAPSGPASGQGDNHLSLQQNPVRLTSDAARELDALFGITDTCNPQNLQSVGNQTVHEQDRASLTRNPESLPSIASHTAREEETASVMTTSRSMPDMCTVSSMANSTLRSVLEGSNPMLNGESSASSQPGNNPEAAGGTPLSTLARPTVKGLLIRLDPMKVAISDWRDLASHFGVPPELINYWKGMMSGQGNFSPTDSLIEWLKSKPQPVTVDDLKAALRKIERFDVLRVLNEPDN
ncbi:uncharacterized protein LOC110983960 isoform X2 [Acanthaster planci]|uniref:Uncharacterized protein LOC110983960 isoform X2 n=1 Tax=Acanthaster planci TaxID=133434 RepID=A0A8B7Z1B3_ACAPL|nr:uncharacterized protein LOC110983960 isoform X2 [Acanthaster planci]